MAFWLNARARRREGYTTVGETQDADNAAAAAVGGDSEGLSSLSAKQSSGLFFLLAPVILLVLIVATITTLSTGNSEPATGASILSSLPLPLLSQSLKDGPSTTATADNDNDDDHHEKETAEERLKRCRNVDWQQACEKLTGAGARRRRRLDESSPGNSQASFLEEFLLDSDDPSVTYDEHCLRVYRLDLFGDTTFPYHANQLLRTGGNQTMALFIQHGAMRDADNYFCSFRKLMLEQPYRPFKDILIVAPDFNYKNDAGVLPTDAFWNSTKPWGDWRVGAESDPECCGNGFGSHSRRTISSFEILDHMLRILTDKSLYPKLDKISYVGHSAGGQMVQRYAIMSQLAEHWDLDPSVDVEFIVANPSSYTYLDDRRWSYSCGDCSCNSDNCTCDKDCQDVTKSQLAIPTRHGAGKDFVCYDAKYDQWPYGLGSFDDNGKHIVLYATANGRKHHIKHYKKRHVVYMVGQNDTCNDGLPTCSADCWKRETYLEDEWPCYRNHMDTRCPAMLEGPYRRARGVQYMKYLEDLYGEKTHVLHVIPGVGHNATAMLGSPIALEELFD